MARLRERKSPEARRNAFLDVFGELAAAREERRGHDRNHPIEVAFSEALVRAAREAGCRNPLDKDGNRDPSKVLRALGQERIERIRAPFEAQAMELGARVKARIERAEARLRTLSSPDILRPGPRALEMFKTWRSDYSTQGYGSERYAKGRAEMVADLARYYKIEVRVERVASESGVVASSRTNPLVWFTVTVMVEHEADVEMLRLLPGEPFSETVRTCWSRGVNPRVYFPGLPHGYEERNGFDSFGRRKGKTCGTASLPS